MNKTKWIKSKRQLNQLIEHCKTTGYCSLDFETTGFNFKSLTDYILLMGVSFQPGSSWIMGCGHKESPFKKNWEKLFRKFGKEVLENPDIVKVCWNLKFEYKWCMRYDIFMKGRLFDSMLAKYCLDEERPHDLKSFVKNVFTEFSGYEDKLKDDNGEGVDWKNVPYKKLGKYCGIDTDTTLRGMYLMEPKLIKQGFYTVFRNMLMMITRVLAEAEYFGILVDRVYLEQLMKEYTIKIAYQNNKLKNDPSVLKYESKYKKYHLQQLIEKVNLEITAIRKEGKPNAERLIANRDKKIKDFLEGKFSKKDSWDHVNFGSPKQIGDFLFTSKFGLRLKPYKFTKNKKTGQRTTTPSTDEESLLQLKKHDKTGFMTVLLDLRALEKLDSTYITGMHSHLDVWDRVHAGFKINGTVTARLSCVNPNLQNIPRGSTAADIKRMFIPPPGYLLWELDYSQAELRIIAELSQDKAMIEIFKKNYNIHVATACKMNGGLDLYAKVKGILKIAEAMDAKDLELPKNKEYLFWVKQKKKGKSLNFSIVYQQGDDATAETLECSKDEAKQFKAEWFKQFPQVRKWIDKTKRDAHRNEYVYNMFGTKRRLHDINCGIGWKEAEAERQAVNAPVQGASGYFTLLSMIVIREKILRGELPRDLLPVYTVHDSMGYYGKPHYVSKVMPKLIKICDNPDTEKYFGFRLKDVEMKASPEVGKHWAALKDWDPWEDYTKWVDSAA